MFFIGFAIFPPFTLFNHTPPQVLIYQTTCQAKPIKFLIILHKDHKTLWAKYIIHEKGESLRVACLSTLDNTVNSYKILSSIQSMLISLSNVDAPSFSQPYLCLQSPLQSPPKIHSSTSDNFQLPNPPLLVCKIILTIPTKTPFLYTSATFHIQTIYIQNIFPTSTI